MNVCDEYRDIKYDFEKMKQEKCPNCNGENDGKYVRIMDMITFKCGSSRCNKQWTQSLNSFIKE